MFMLYTLFFRAFKALKLTKATRRHTTVGEIVNLMSVDAQKLQEVPTYVSSLWSTLVTSIVCVGVLWQTVGIAVLSAILLLLILILFNGFYIGNQIHLSQVLFHLYFYPFVTLMSIMRLFYLLE